MPAMTGDGSDKGDGDGAQTFRVPADAYDGHVGRYGSELARGLTGFAGVTPGETVLDIGCGTGLLTAELATIVGERGRVAAVEPSAPFAAACRQRVPASSVSTARAEALPFGPATFDTVLSQLVVNFLTDPAAGIREMRRVTRRGGTVAASVWDYAGEMRLLRAFWDAAAAVDPGAAALDEGRTMAFCDPASLAALWKQGGLTDVAVVELRPSVRYADFAELWEPFTRGVGPSGAFAAGLDGARRAALREEFFGRLGQPAGAFTLGARAWAVRGRAVGAR